LALGIADLMDGGEFVAIEDEGISIEGVPSLSDFSDA
jgi:hypothetical protein